MNIYLPYVAVLWLSFINIDYVDASFAPADLAAIVADDAEASGCTVDARGTCVDEFTPGNQEDCGSLMTFHNCALTSVLTTPECTANTAVTDYVQTIEKLMIHTASECASENNCDSVFPGCFNENKDKFDVQFGSGEVDDVQHLNYSVNVCYLLTDVVHCLYLQQDTGCYPWLSDVTFDTMTETIGNRCPALDEHPETMLWLPPVDDSQDLFKQCMNHEKSCEIAFHKLDPPAVILPHCSAFLQFFGCVLGDVRSLSTGCKANSHVMNFIDLFQKNRLHLVSACGSNIDCSSSSYDTCMGDHLEEPVFGEDFEVDTIKDMVYTASICSAFRRSVYCLDTISSSCTSGWLPPSAVQQMSDDLTDASCAMGDLPPSLMMSSPATTLQTSSHATTLKTTRMLAVVTIILYFIQ